MKIEIYDVLVLDFGDGISSNFPLVASLVPNSRGLISDANSLIPWHHILFSSPHITEQKFLQLGGTTRPLPAEQLANWKTICSSSLLWMVYGLIFPWKFGLRTRFPRKKKYYVSGTLKSVSQSHISLHKRKLTLHWESNQINRLQKCLCVLTLMVQSNLLRCTFIILFFVSGTLDGLCTYFKKSWTFWTEDRAWRNPSIIQWGL